MVHNFTPRNLRGRDVGDLLDERIASAKNCEMLTHIESNEENKTNVLSEQKQYPSASDGPLTLRLKRSACGSTELHRISELDMLVKMPYLRGHGSRRSMLNRNH